MKPSISKEGLCQRTLAIRGSSLSAIPLSRSKSPSSIGHDSTPIEPGKAKMPVAHRGMSSRIEAVSGRIKRELRRIPSADRQQRIPHI